VTHEAQDEAHSAGDRRGRGGRSIRCHRIARTDTASVRDARCVEHAGRDELAEFVGFAEPSAADAGRDEGTVPIAGTLGVVRRGWPVVDPAACSTGDRGHDDAAARRIGKR